MSADELGRLVAYVFNALGKRRIGEEDWVRLLALDRKWMPPSQARALAARARQLGLLRNAGERDFDMGLEAEGISLPVDYRPDGAALETMLKDSNANAPGARRPEPLFRRVVATIAKNLGQSEAEVVARVNATQQATGNVLSAEVAAIYYGALQGVDGSAFYEEAAASLQGRA